MRKIKDIAREAGVSVASVSRVVSGNRPVTSETEAAVRTAIERLGYRPNHVARALRVGSTKTVGMIVPQIANPLFTEIVQVVERSLQSHEIDLFLCDCQENPEIENRRISALLQRRVDGLIVISCKGRPSKELQRALGGTPIVIVDRIVQGIKADFVGVNNAIGIASVIQHLEHLGRYNLAFIGAQPLTSTAKERRNAFLRWAKTHSFSEQMFLGSFSMDWGFEAAARLLSKGPLPNGIVCANDLIALGAIRCLKEKGVRVPEDIAVTGFDDIGFASICEPGVTTVRQPVASIGGRAVDLLVRRLSKARAKPTYERIKPELVIRGSTTIRIQSPGAPNSATITHRGIPLDLRLDLSSGR
jgi:LacI family transcriptional regulator